MIDLKNIVAIDVHTHVEVSCRQPHDDYRLSVMKPLRNSSKLRIDIPFRNLAITTEALKWHYYRNKPNVLKTSGSLEN